MTVDVEISIAVAEEIDSWRRVFAARKDNANARDLLRKAATDLWQILDIDNTVHPELNGAARQEVVDASQDMADSAAIAPDDAQLIFTEAKDISRAMRPIHRRIRQSRCRTSISRAIRSRRAIGRCVIASPRAMLRCCQAKARSANRLCCCSWPRQPCWPAIGLASCRNPAR